MREPTASTSTSAWKRPEPAYSSLSAYMRTSARSYSRSRTATTSRAGPDVHPALQREVPKVVKKITDDEGELLVFYDFPAEHWIQLRTTKPAESTFATVRLDPSIVSRRLRDTEPRGSTPASLRLRLAVHAGERRPELRVTVIGYGRRTRPGTHRRASGGVASQPGDLDPGVRIATGEGAAISQNMPATRPPPSVRRCGRRHHRRDPDGDEGQGMRTVLASATPRTRAIRRTGLDYSATARPLDGTAPAHISAGIRPSAGGRARRGPRRTACPGRSASAPSARGSCRSPSGPPR